MKEQAPCLFLGKKKRFLLPMNGCTQNSKCKHFIVRAPATLGRPSAG